MININSLNNEIFDTLKRVIESESNNHNAIVRKRVIEKQYPLIIFECRSNTQSSASRDFYGIERTRALSFEIDIYAVDDRKNNISAEMICDDLENLVTQVMQGIYRMQGGTDAKLHNINSENATQYVLHFNCEWYMNKKIIY